MHRRNRLHGFGDFYWRSCAICLHKQMVRVERVVTYPNSPSKPDVRLSPHRLLVCLALVMCTAFRCFRIRGWADKIHHFSSRILVVPIWRE
jgi:hypothetical protein